MMHLLRTDEQTIGDLEIFGKKTGSGIFDIYNQAHTRRRSLAGELFRQPLSNREAINQRSNVIESFASLKVKFPYDSALFDTAEKYLVSAEDEGKSKNNQAVMGEKEIQNGVLSVIQIIQLTKAFTQRPEIQSITNYNSERRRLSYW
ncbi:hypothetical protein KRR40_44535 [Niabella defluvii]|nr:hypothetical protein KRR40_44535 [Niabella sp. I65]